MICPRVAELWFSTIDRPSSEILMLEAWKPCSASGVSGLEVRATANHSLGAPLAKILSCVISKRFESHQSGGMPAAFDVTILSRNHFASSAHRMSRSCPADGAVQGILAKSKHSSFHQIAQAIAVDLPVECPDRTETRASGSAMAFSRFRCCHVGFRPRRCFAYSSGCLRHRARSWSYSRCQSIMLYHTHMRGNGRKGRFGSGAVTAAHVHGSPLRLPGLPQFWRAARALSGSLVRCCVMPIMFVRSTTLFTPRSLRLEW
jgi:hypothetical protein